MKNKKVVTIFLLLVVTVFFSSGCGENAAPPVSDSGVSKTTAQVQKGSDGLTAEQRNVKKRLELENKPGAIQYLYVISAFSGQVILFSTVDGKVTSSGKRLTPLTVSARQDSPGFPITINGSSYETNEVLQDDGTYGNSIDYLYWWDTKGIYHQHYVTGGQIIEISDQPLPVKSIVINMELQKAPSK